jgi:hypothetical protein
VTRVSALRRPPGVPSAFCEGRPLRIRYDMPVSDKPTTTLAKHPHPPTEYGLGVLKGIIGAVPYIGTALNEILFDVRSRLKQERLNSFFVEVAAEVAQLREGTIAHDFLKSEDFSDLVEDICVRVTRARSASRRKDFRKILLDAFQGRSQPDLGPLFLDLLER